MTVVGIFALHLTCPSRQQMLQRPKAVLDPVAPLPRPDKPRPADGRVETHQVELCLPRLLNHEERHRAIRWTNGTQPRIAHPRDLLALSPRPLAVLLQIMPLNLSSVGQFEDIGTLPFHQESALVHRGDIAHEL